MTINQHQGELRLSETVPPAILRLRRSERELTPPEVCRLGPECLVCRWRREGLIPAAGIRPSASSAKETAR